MDNSYEIIKHRGHGHMRSASLENANSLISKNTLGLPSVILHNNHSGGNGGGFMMGTLKLNNEQKCSLKNKYGSYNNLDEYGTIHNKSKFQNLKNMFETKIDYDGTSNSSGKNSHNSGGGNCVVNSRNLQNIKLQQHHNHRHHSHQRSQQQSTQLQNQCNQIQPQKSTECNENNSNVMESSLSAVALHETKINSGNVYQAKNLLKPIPFKPIPFEPDYSIPNRYVEFCDRYGSTPSLAPVQGTNMKFGSTSDLQHGYTYCANLARRRSTRSFKINDSMESISHTPDSDATSQNSTIKLIRKFSQDQFNTTPSPSDSGISDLEAALKDRDSELSYLRQTMEHNEKVIFKVHKDKEACWEQETTKLKNFYENQQRQYISKIKKLEQMLTLQSFQFKQNRLRFSEDSNRLKEQFTDLKNESELLRNETDELKSIEKTMRDRVNQLEQKVDVMNKLIINLKSQLEENEWTVCQKNGEIALLKTQLKEAKMELILKEHEIVHIKTEIQNKADEEENIYSSSIRDEFKSDTEKSQINRIIILKDQVILALTNELTKLRKELSELAITHEYGEEPSGKYSRLKYKIENLANICRYQQYHQNQQGNNENEDLIDIEKSLNDNQIKKKHENFEENDLEIILNCLTAPIQFENENSNFSNEISSSNYEDVQISKINSFIGNNKTASHKLQNLPDVTQNRNNRRDEIIKPMSTITVTPVLNDGGEDSKMHLIKTELDEVRQKFELEKQKWAEEKDKVLKYQRQLQTHYIHMYQKMKELENRLSKNF